MFVIVLLFGLSTAATTQQQQQQRGGDLEGDGTQKHYVYRPQEAEEQDVPVVFPSSRSVDLSPVELDYPVKTVQKFTDSDGNVQVVTSYSNRKDSPLPIYRSKPVAQAYPAEDRAGSYAPAPQGRTRHVEVEQRSVPKKQQMTRVQTIRFPDATGEIVDHEEKTSFRDGKSKSFSTQSSYDNSYKKPTLKKSSRSSSESRNSKSRQPVYDESDRSSSLPEANDDEVSFRSYVKPAKKDVTVPSSSDNKPVHRRPASGTSRSAKKSSKARTPARATEKVDHVLEPAGSTYVADIEEIESDEDAYDDSDGYDDHHGVGVEVPIAHPLPLVPIAGHLGPIGHGLGHGHHHHGHEHGIDKGFEKKDGQSYSHGEHFAKGEKGGKGHKSKESYDKGHSEKHGHEHNKGGKKEEVGEKKGHLDEHNSYHKGHSHHKGEKGKEKTASKGHKKGHKTSGFRTVHHKDEYKKDEVFYDEEHDAAQEKHHGNEHGGHQEAKGGESKKGHLDSGYKDAVKGVEGEKKEGHSYEHSKGHDVHSGHKGHEGHKEGFSKGAGHKEEEAHGHVHESNGKGW